MITFDQFKELFNKLEENRNPEIGIYFDNNETEYMIIKFSNYLTFGKTNESQNKIYKFNDIDELYNTPMEDIDLKRDWNKITDILIDLTFSVLTDKEQIKKFYNVDL